MPSLFLTFVNLSLLTKKRGVWGGNGDVLTFLRYRVGGGLPRARRCRMSAPPGLVEDGTIWVLFSTFSSPCYFLFFLLCVFLLKGGGGGRSCCSQRRTDGDIPGLIASNIPNYWEGEDSLLSQPRFCLFGFFLFIWRATKMRSFWMQEAEFRMENTTAANWARARHLYGTMRLPWCNRSDLILCKNVFGGEIRTKLLWPSLTCAFVEASRSPWTHKPDLTGGFLLYM